MCKLTIYEMQALSHLPNLKYNLVTHETTDLGQPTYLDYDEPTTTTTNLSSPERSDSDKGEAISNDKGKALILIRKKA